jgi:phage-related protein
MSTQAFGHYLQFRGGTTLNFQNYWIGENIVYQGVTYSFLPFGFSGVTVTRSGDNQPATLVFPNNALSRGWIETAVTQQWIATCQTLLIDPGDKAAGRVLASYTAQIVSGAWNETSVELRMASVLDAVGADLPRKRLTKQLVGKLPLTARVSLQ